MANQSNYWDQRTLALQNSIAIHEQALFQNLRQYYNKEAAEMDQDIAAYYSKYGTNNVIQYRNLLQSLSDADKQLLYEKIQDFEKQYPQYAHLTPVRESIYKLDRLEGLRTSVAIQQLKMGAYEIAQAQAHFQQMALLSGNFIAEKMGYGSSFYRIDSDMLRLVVGQDWCNNQDFSARIWNNRNALTQTLQTQLVNGMIRGNSYKDISKSVLNKFQTVSQRNIERLVFTEDTFLANEAAMQTYLNDPDYTYYEYVALCDGKTCDLCASLTGERFRISERRPGMNFPPLHPWCRCFFDIVHEKNSGKYIERDSENSRNRRQTGLTASRKNAIMKGRGNGTGSSNNEHYYELIGEIDYHDKVAVSRSLREFEIKYQDSDIEHCLVITTSGKVYEVHGDRWTVETAVLGEEMNGSINEHNHVTGESQYSFSWEDLESCIYDGSKIAFAYDEKYRYSMVFSESVKPDILDDIGDVKEQAKENVYNRIIAGENITDEDLQHEMIKKACEIIGVIYKRMKL
ncbi:MAG: minor capsid protein [Oscillospiraceae bacterium]|nr:minor capsid protein [Oscillospiraceae bacterium]